MAAYGLAAVPRGQRLEGCNGGRHHRRGVALSLLLVCSCGPSTRPLTMSASASDEATDTQSAARAPLEARAPTPAPPFVWADASGEGRAQVVWFRRDLDLATVPGEASLHLFASSRYLLFVNGAVIASGPARSYPEHPEFDSIDLRPFLVAGHNSLAVQVLSFGTSSFQLRRQPGAFVAWGAVRAGDDAFDLSTPGAWKYARDRGYDETAPRMSFAMPPIEVYDARQAGGDFLGGNLLGRDADRAPAGWSIPLP